MTYRPMLHLGMLAAISAPALAGDPPRIDNLVTSRSVEISSAYNGPTNTTTWSSDTTGLFAPADLDRSWLLAPGSYLSFSADHSYYQSVDGTQNDDVFSSYTTSTLITFDLNEPSVFTLTGLLYTASDWNANGRLRLTGPDGDIVFDEADPFQTSEFDYDLSGELAPGSYEFELFASTYVASPHGFSGGGFAQVWFNELNLLIVPAPGALTLFAMTPLALRRRR